MYSQCQEVVEFCLEKDFMSNICKTALTIKAHGSEAHGHDTKSCMHTKTRTATTESYLHVGTVA